MFLINNKRASNTTKEEVFTTSLQKVIPFLIDEDHQEFTEFTEFMGVWEINLFLLKDRAQDRPNDVTQQ